MSTATRSGWTRAMTLITAALAAGLALAGCSGDGGTAGGDDPANDNSLQEVLDRGVLRVGACLTLPPWGSIGSDGKPEGFDIDLSNQLGDFLGVPVEITEVNGAGRVPAIQSGQVDVSACTFTITPERLEQVAFSDPVIGAGTSLVVMKGSDIASLDDIDGRSVAVTKGGTAGPIIEGLVPGAQLQYFDNPADVFLALRQGQVDAAVEASGTVSTAAAEDDQLVIVEDATVGDRVFYALGVAKDKPALLDEVNEFVAQFHSSGADVELFEKWFTFPVTNQFDDLPPTQNTP